MSDKQLMDIHQQMFFEFGKHELWHFESVREIVIIKYNGNILDENDILKIFKY